MKAYIVNVVKSSIKQLLDKLEHLALIFAIFTVSLFLFNDTFLANIIIAQKAIKPEKELSKAQQTRGHTLYLSILIHHHTFLACKKYSKECDKIAQSAKHCQIFALPIL